MADGQLDKFIESLEATFDARVSRDEDEAAADLAFSLLQDQRLIDALGRLGPCDLRLPERPAAPITEIGEDYVRAGDVVVPLESVIAQPAPDRGDRPATREASLLELLRRVARAGGRVEVAAGAQRLVGRLSRACADHVALATPRGELVLAAGVVQEIRILDDSEGRA